MEPDSFFHHANICFVNENFKEAAHNFSLAIDLRDDKYQFYSHRAAAYLKLGQLERAQEDIDKSLKLKPDHLGCVFRRGQILFASQNYADAKTCFSSLANKEGVPHAEETIQMWIRKCDAELQGARLMVTPGAHKAATSGAKLNGKANQDVQKNGKSPENKAPEQEEVPPLSPQSNEHAEAKPAPAIRHQWYQSPTRVNVSIFAKNRKEDDVDVTFGEKSLKAAITLDDNDVFLLDFSLFAKIVPGKSKVDVGKVKIEIQMEKATEGENWPALEHVSLDKDMPAYPTSSKVKKDWSDMDKSCQQELDQDKPEGDEALNTLFREIYGNANEETRRAMVKSFQTSGGTVLSTNWDEVGKADYEGKDRPDPPDGQTWAKK
eukprot:GEMP01027973.1.p1 GENE.GEMP01027973.1~~GEMP01027973.1.p1  ORF type:complete len:400 (+),score=85.86 GEMP01027973.1:72-1202(+)